MCVDFGPWLVKLGSLTFVQLANVQTVGIGLYLALAVIQGVTDGGVAGLRRRANTLDAAISAARKTALKPEAGGILTDVSGLEMGFQRTNQTVLYVVLTFFTVSVGYFAYCTIWQESQAQLDGTLFILFFYLALPIIIFVGVGLYVRGRCGEIDRRINRLQSDYLAAALGSSNCEG